MKCQICFNNEASVKLTLYNIECCTNCLNLLVKCTKCKEYYFKNNGLNYCFKCQHKKTKYFVCQKCGRLMPKKYKRKTICINCFKKGEKK